MSEFALMKELERVQEAYWGLWRKNQELEKQNKKLQECNDNQCEIIQKYIVVVGKIETALWVQ